MKQINSVVLMLLLAASTMESQAHKLSHRHSHSHAHSLIQLNSHKGDWDISKFVNEEEYTGPAAIALKEQWMPGWGPNNQKDGDDEEIVPPTAAAHKAYAEQIVNKSDNLAQAKVVPVQPAANPSPKPISDIQPMVAA